ncbi:hypothetical protein CMV60_01275 [Serratia marcescens]|nr:hypothetical protein CMV60_01275 [Serratia marcescens]
MSFKRQSQSVGTAHGRTSAAKDHPPCCPDGCWSAILRALPRIACRGPGGARSDRYGQRNTARTGTHQLPYSGYSGLYRTLFAAVYGALSASVRPSPRTGSPCRFAKRKYRYRVTVQATIGTGTRFDIQTSWHQPPHSGRQPEYLRLHAPIATPEDLLQHAILHYDANAASPNWRLKHRVSGEEKNLVQEPILISSDYETLLQAAIQDLGVAMLPDIACLKALAKHELCVVLPEWEALELLFHLTFLTRRGMLPSVRALIDFLSESLPLIAVRKVIPSQ